MEITGILGRMAAMFKVNDVIIYGTQGVCQIIGIEEKNISSGKKSYFVLMPINGNGPTIYAPTDNKHVLSKMRRLLSKAEIDELINSMPNENAVWVKNDNERKERYKKILAGGDHVELIKMIKAIYAHKKEREAEGKRLHMMDEGFFKDAEQILYHEFQYVLKLKNKEEVMAYIFSRIEE